jgi:uncharacterized protein
VKRLFVDTAGWMACADANDPDHAQACACRDEWLRSGGVLVSSDFVIDETLTLIRIRLGIDAAERWWQQVQESQRLTWEWIDTVRLDRAQSWFFRWRDKDFSFTDCTSFVIMKEKRIQQVLTTDRHFVVAGFQVLPTQGPA